MNKEYALIIRIFERDILKFSEKERVVIIDAFSQFSQNPTSMSAGYGVEKNYPLIAENIKKRYDIGKITINNVIDFLKKIFEEMNKINYDVYVWRDAIADFIKNRYAKNILQQYNLLYEHLTKDKKMQFLFVLHFLNYTDSIRDIHRWFSCFFDKEEKLSQSDIEDLLVRWRIGNILYYRSSSSSERSQFIPYYFLDILRERLTSKIPIDEKQIEDFFKNLLIGNMRLLEKCVKESIPVLENKAGRITQVAPLIVECSKSYFAISPFVLDNVRELIKTRKEELTNKWKIKLSDILNTFVGENYPYLDMKSIFDIEGAYCWEIRYVETLEKEPINVTILLSPYIFLLDRYSSIIDHMKGTSRSPFNFIFLIKETLPTIIDALRYTSSQKYLIFLYEEKTKNFYLIEKGTLPEEFTFTADSFLSSFFPSLEKEIHISRTFPEHLKDYMENLRYFNQFPKLVSIRNRMLKVEPKLRESIRGELMNRYGVQWKDKIIEFNPTLVKKIRNVVRKRLDKEKAKDFLDGATLGELISIVEKFPDIFRLEKNLVKGFLNILNQHRKILEHPFEVSKEDFDEKTFQSFNAALDYFENVICTE